MERATSAPARCRGRDCWPARLSPWPCNTPPRRTSRGAISDKGDVMYRSIRFSLLTALVLIVPSLRAQSGHWEGAIQAPSKDVKIEIDLAMKDGKLAGTFGTPEQN